MMKIYLYLTIFISSFILYAQEEIIEEPISKIEQLILDIESEIDIEKRFDFSRSNSKETQLSDLKRIHKKLEFILKCLEKI